MGNIFNILPDSVNGYPVEYTPDSAGGIQVTIWRTASRHDGFCFRATNRRHARKLLRDIERRARP